MQIRTQRISPDAFAPYGTMAKVPSDHPTAEDATFKYWSDAAHFQIEDQTEIGFCTVYRQPEAQVTWMERHERTPELLIPIDSPFILPVMEGEQIEAFRVEPGEAVVIGPNVWHSACHPADSDTATYFVIFRRGTPQEDVIKTTLTPTGLST